MAVGNRYVEIDLDKTRRVRYTINAMRELEAELGGGFNSIFTQEGMGFDHVTKLLFFGLKHGDPQAMRRDIPNVAKLGDVLQKHWFDADKGNLTDIVEIVMNAMQAGGIIPEDEEVDEDEVTDPNDPLVD